MKLGKNDVLIVVDVQNDFLPGGALAVPDGHAVIAPINRLANHVPHVIVTQDWHTPGHTSCASSHLGRAPFETITMPYGEQVLWPDHCVQGTKGAELAHDLDVRRSGLVIRKGFHSHADSYSAFMEADRATHTGLAGYLRERGLTRLFIAGLATDFCVAWTALDARAAGFATIVIEDAVRGINLDGSVARAWEAMAQAGVERVQSASVA